MSIQLKISKVFLSSWRSSALPTSIGIHSCQLRTHHLNSLTRCFSELAIFKPSAIDSAIINVLNSFFLALIMAASREYRHNTRYVPITSTAVMNHRNIHARSSRLN